MQTCLRLPEVERLTGRKKPSIYVGIKDGTFPKPIKIGVRAVAWLSSDIEGWINDRARESGKAVAT